MSFITGLATAYTDIGQILQKWDQVGVFAYILPFLLIFALVFAILSRINMFQKKKGVTALISIVVGLLAIVYPDASYFFNIVFSRLGIGLAIILVALILIGAFVPTDGWGSYIFMGIGVLAFLIIILGSFTDYSWWDSFIWRQHYMTIIVVLATAAAVVLVIVFSKSGDGKDKNK